MWTEFRESGGMDPSDSSRISSNDSDGNKELGVQPYLYEPETNTEGNANIIISSILFGRSVPEGCRALSPVYHVVRYPLSFVP